MIVIRDPALNKYIAGPEIRRLAERRFGVILAGEAFDYDRHGYMIVVEAGDAANTDSVIISVAMPVPETEEVPAA